MKIDVLVRTRNSDRLLEECLDSIYREVRVCNLADGMDQDRSSVTHGFPSIGHTVNRPRCTPGRPCSVQGSKVTAGGRNIKSTAASEGRSRRARQGRNKL